MLGQPSRHAVAGGPQTSCNMWGKFPAEHQNSHLSCFYCCSLFVFLSACAASDVYFTDPPLLLLSVPKFSFCLTGCTRLYSLIRLSCIQQTRTTFTYTLVGTIPSIVILGCAEKVYASLGRLCKDLIESPKLVFESNYKRFLHLFLVAAVIFDHLIDA